MSPEEACGSIRAWERTNIGGSPEIGHLAQGHLRDSEVLSQRL